MNFKQYLYNFAKKIKLRKFMKNKYVDFVSDEHLLNCISALYTSYINAKKDITKKKFYDNKIDVFKMLFDKKFRNLTDEQLIESEIERQVDRTIVNAIGTFHENVLSGVTGYAKVGTGIDIKSTDDKIFIELKNKFNTVKGEDNKSIFTKLLGEIEKNPNSRAYFARILDVKSTNSNWSFSHKKVPFGNENIFIISGDQLYKLVTGKEDSLFLLYKNLPYAISDFLSSIKAEDLKENSALSEIKESASKSKRTILDEITFENFNYYLGFDKL